MEHRISLESLQGIWVSSPTEVGIWHEALGSSRASVGIVRSLSCCLREIRPPFKLQEHLVIPLESLLENCEGCHIEMRWVTRGSLSSCNSNLGVPIKFQQSQTLSQCSVMELNFPLELDKGCQVSLSSCDGELGPFQRCNRGL